MRLLVVILVLAVIVSVSGTASASAVQSVGTSSKPVSGELQPFLSGSAGGGDIAVQRAYYRSDIAGRPAPDGHLYVVVVFSFKNLSGSPIIPKEKLEVRIEDAAQSIEGWPIDWEATGLVGEEANFWTAPLDRNVPTRAAAAFAVPVATKGLWLRVDSKIAASPEKVYSGCIRGQLGDLPGGESVKASTSGFYRVIVGSYWIKKYADMFAASVRAKGTNAWLEQVSRPQGMYVVVVYSNPEYHQAQFVAGNIRHLGYTDAYVISPPASTR